jgi:peptidoglycan/xylan/chitin deacetylase (PgdA/CDA1 family)
VPDIELMLRQARSQSEPSLGERLRRALKNLSHNAGLTPALDSGPAGATAVLFYHKVQRRPTGLWGEPALCVEAFDQQMAHLARHYEVLPAARLVDAVERRRTMPARSVVITFDDGYRNNLILAAPVLRRHRIPATLFVSTGLVGSRQWMWAYELEEMLLRFPPEEVGRAAGDPVVAAICRHGGPRLTLVVACAEYLKTMPNAARLRVMDSLRGRLPVEIDDENRFLSWDEVRELRSYGVEIGGHTVNHPVLLRVPFDEAEREVASCRERIADELGVSPTLFAYPNGDTSPAITAMVGRHFRAAFTTRQKMCTPGCNPLLLPRFAAPNTHTELSFDLTRQFVAERARAGAGGR